MVHKHSKSIALEQGDILIIVDLQNDFLPGGALPVYQGDQVVSVMNRYIGLFQRHGLPIMATRDWHPPDHCSFKAQGGPWPGHCVMGSHGAEFSPDLELPENAEIFSAGVKRNALGYSGFEDTDLDNRLTELHAKRLFIGGLATDYCVLNTVSDALAHGYPVYLLTDAIRAVDVEPQNGQNAINKMLQKGAIPITLSDL
ncbi:MAG: isochorismatase family protein [Gammaproteobacteria bacterium]